MRGSGRPSEVTLTAQISQLEQEIAEVFADGAWARSACLLQSIPGVGVVTAAWLLVTTLNFTVSSTPTALAAYAGLAPMPYESATSIRGQPRIGQSGNTRLRHAVYMAALSASRHNPMIRVFYQRLRDAGKPIKVARCAAARKLLHLAWAVVTKQQAFDPRTGCPGGSYRSQCLCSLITEIACDRDYPVGLDRECDQR